MLISAAAPGTRVGTAQNLGIVNTAFAGSVALRINYSIVEKEIFWWNRVQFPVVAPIGLAIHIGIMAL